MLDALTLDQLRVLDAVADAGSFSAAARRLGRVQSAVSQAVQALEGTLGVALFDRSGRTPKLTDAGHVILADARSALASVEALRARALSIASAVEPELSLAVDSIFPNALLRNALRAVAAAFPQLSVRLFTEGLGGAEQRLRDGVAQLGIYSIAVTGATDLTAEFMTAIPFVPVVAAGHPLAAAPSPVTRERLRNETQLVLTDRTPLSENLWGAILSTRIWRFADLGTRLDYLRAGFGWCNMPIHLVADDIATGRLVRLRLEELDGYESPVYAVHLRGKPPGRAGRWLLERLKGALADANRPTAP